MRWCHLAQEECVDGKTDKSQMICSFWDSDIQRCLMVGQAALMVELQCRQLARMDEAEQLEQEIIGDQKLTGEDMEGNMRRAREFGESLRRKRGDSELPKV